MAQSFELNTTISNLRDLTESDLSPYDALYLGNITCRLYEANLLERLDDLREAIAIVKGRGQKAYVTTYAAPRNDNLPQLRKVMAVAVETGADAVEVHNLGVLKIVHEEYPDLAVHIGGFANVYTDVGAAVLKRYGTVRITPNYELSLEEIGEIYRQVGLPMELLVHGKMPLGMSDNCFLLEYEQAWGGHMPDALPARAVPETERLGDEDNRKRSHEREGCLPAGAPDATDDRGAFLFPGRGGFRESGVPTGDWPGLP